MQLSFFEHVPAFVAGIVAAVAPVAPPSVSSVKARILCSRVVSQYSKPFPHDWNFATLENHYELGKMLNRVGYHVGMEPDILQILIERKWSSESISFGLYLSNETTLEEDYAE